MYKKFYFAMFAVFLLYGCVSVPMESTENSDRAKKFDPPSNSKAALYIYRSGSFGAALKKNIWVDGQCIGETAPNIFFREEVQGGMDHKVSTESEFSPNDLLVKTEAGKIYFVRQYMKFGVFIGGAGLELVDEEEGKTQVTELKLAQKGTCTKDRSQ